MKSYNYQKEVRQNELGNTVLIDGKEVYINAEFIYGKMLSGDFDKTDWTNFIKLTLIPALILMIILLIIPIIFWPKYFLPN